MGHLEGNFTPVLYIQDARFLKVKHYMKADFHPTLLISDRTVFGMFPGYVPFVSGNSNTKTDKIIQTYIDTCTVHFCYI